MQARREAVKLVRINDTTHVGLWLDRYLDDQHDQRSKDQDDKGKKAEHFRSVQRRPIPKGYVEAFDRWKRTFSARDGTILVTPIEATGRIALGLGNKGVLENGLQLDHTWGVPIIPGSALKGVAAAAAHRLAQDDGWRKYLEGDKKGAASSKRGPYHAALFGQGGAARSEGDDCIGAVKFHDAWWIPRDARERPEPCLPIDLDIMTVHHADYYLGKDAAPLDTDSPNPVPFATLSGRYLLVIELTQPDIDARWLDLALDLLEEGLAELGLGAKTNAGYGRMTLVVPEKTAVELRKLHEEASLPGEVRWPRDQATLLEQPPAEQVDWLLQHGATLPDGYAFTEVAWRSVLAIHFSAALDLVKQGPQATVAAVDLDADIAALKRRRHEVQNSPVNKRDDKAVRRRRAELESLEQQLRLKESQKANQAAFVEREAAARQALEATRQAFLSWWFKE